MTIERIALDSILLSGECQLRSGIVQDVVDDYAALLIAGVDLPPVTVFADGRDTFLADGYHRHAAHKKLGHLTIVADLRSGTQRDAVLFSLGANKEHGLRRTNADKRRVVERMLADDEWSRWSDRAIAQHCGVSHVLVASVRDATGNSSSCEPGKRVGLDGKSRCLPTGNISSSAPPTGRTSSSEGINPEVVAYVTANLPSIASDQAEMMSLAAMPVYRQREALEMVIGGGAETIAEAKRYIERDDALAELAAETEPQLSDPLASLKEQIDALDFDQFDALAEWFDARREAWRAKRAPNLRLVR